MFNVGIWVDVAVLERTAARNLVGGTLLLQLLKKEASIT
jgi:hypothetical protein